MITILKLRPDNHVLISAFTLLFCLLMFTQSTQAEPDFKIPPIQESMKKMYQIQQKDFTFEDKHYRLSLRYRQKTIAKTDRTLHFRWQCTIFQWR